MQLKAFILRVRIRARSEPEAHQRLEEVLHRGQAEKPVVRALDGDLFAQAMVAGRLGREQADPVRDGRASYRAARMVLVERKSIAEAKRTHGVSQQAVSKAMQRVRSVLLAGGECPCCRK
jgi:hypothetical protein